MGNLGDGSNTDRTTPVQVVGITNSTQVAGGGEHSLFVRGDGTAWACGLNASGQLGNGNTTNTNTPIQVNGLTGIIQAAAGAEYSLFLKSDGTVWAAGRNQYGQLGDGTAIDRWTPVQVVASWSTETIIRAEAAREHSIFLTTTGAVWATGRNNYGQLGNGVFNMTNSTSPVRAVPVCTALVTDVIHNENDNTPLVIFPNPSNGKMQIVSSGILESQLKVFSVTGGCIYHSTITSSQHEVDLSGQPVGAYFYQLFNDRKILHTGKIIVE